MQLYARDSTGKKCSIYTAQKGNDYFCLECNGRVRARFSRFFRAHFYHIQDVVGCRQAGKTEAHIAIQKLIQQQIGADRCIEEMRFEQIGRIADVAWPEKKMIFEVQCSPISELEIEERNRDYACCGWSVVWVLHDKRYNKKRTTPIERYLYTHTHYYSDVKTIYDQLRPLGKKRPIELSCVSPLVFDDKLPYLPDMLEKRFYSWECYTKGDYLFAALHEGYRFAKPNYSYLQAAKRSLRAVWHFILERSCS